MKVALAVQFDKQASQTRNYWVAKNATLARLAGVAECFACGEAELR
jgi:hypothetical protein